MRRPSGPLPHGGYGYLEGFSALDLLQRPTFSETILQNSILSASWAQYTFSFRRCKILPARTDGGNPWVSVSALAFTL